MFCQNCGAELASDAQFCENCGTKVEETKEVITAETITDNVNNKVTKKLSKKTTTIIGAACILVIVFAIIVTNMKATINLNKYVTFDFSGYDTLGTAQVSIDYDALERDYGDKIKYYGSDSYGNFEEPYRLLIEECVNGSLDVKENLKNGDTVTYTWDCDKELAKKDFKIKLKAEDITYSVSGLQAVTEIDPFENVELAYEGIAPMGRADVVNSSSKEYISDLHFNVEPSQNLSNGSKVVVSLGNYWGEDVVNYYLKNYGIKLTATEKEYTVEGLGSYITSLDQLSEETLAKMKKQVEDGLKANVAKAWDEHESLEGMTYLGNYLLIPKNPENRDNKVCLIYKVQASDNYEDKNIHDQFSYYYCTYFEEVAVLPDGTCTVDLDHYQVAYDNFSRKVQYGSKSYEYDTYYYHGYESLDDLFKNCVTALVDNYEYESNVTDIVSESQDGQEESSSEQ